MALLNRQGWSAARPSLNSRLACCKPGDQSAWLARFPHLIYSIRSYGGKVSCHAYTPRNRKGVSFLSRFIPNKKKASTIDGFADDVSENGDVPRPEGMDAPAFRHTVDNMGFSPKYPQPPAYIKVRTKYKKEKQFDRMFLAQELRSATDKKSPPVVGANPAPQSGSAASHNPIWATEFSKDGRYLAAGGQDRIVRVWAVISSPAERGTHEKDESDPGYDDGSRLSAPVFQQKPVREYHGHTSTILDLSWSKVGFPCAFFWSYG